MNVLELTRELVSIPSVNPDSLPDGMTSPGEGAMAARIGDILLSLGAAIETWETFPGRPSVCGFLNFGASETLIFDAHLDTVPVEGMTIDPFTPSASEAMVSGRGACDVKGPAAAMLCALHDIRAAAKAGITPRYNVLYAGVSDEESGFAGVKGMVQRLSMRDHSLFGGLNIVGAVVAEPTLLNPVKAHKGVIRWTISTHGVASHSSTPHLGKNAVYAMAPVLAALQAHADDLQARTPDPELGAPTLSVGIIQGGSAVNIVPDLCEIQVDRRLVPGETPMSALKDLQDSLRQVSGIQDIIISDPIVAAPPLAPRGQATLLEQALAAATAAGMTPTVQVANYCTDAPFYAANGIPAIVFGPGSIEQAHTKDEWISTGQLEAGVAAYRHLLLGEMIRQ